ncbi:PucR family transcriptional regulator [Alkalicoccobacillus porphyridii]|uniref:PucR family transcriptional regulator n=1 Tax=Alkalicoccobacillus porphyridii TaxID=2597270 RepID=A0A554A3R3_9BACI|nr:PucR family transcriptional regulator [Alkalicoccobacillus porphyridii]TSB48296.1 PucR family transcriptional regulator [Alkalicoccobacillus porphyridii]
MVLTMKEIMELDIMEPAVVKTASAHLDEQMVEWVSITEAPVENFVRKNEMVLTTGISYADTPHQFYQFVHDVIQSGAAGLGIATGKYIYELCDRCIELGEEYEFPILLMPWEIRFADVTQAITQRITDLKQGYLFELQSIQQELLSMVLEGAPLSKLASHVANHIQADVYMTDLYGSIKGTNNDKELTFWESFFSREVEDLVKPLEQKDHPLLVKVELIESEKGAFIRLPIIQSNNLVQGYVYKRLAENQDTLSASVCVTLEHTATAAAFWFLKENALLEAESKVKNHFVWELAKDQIESNELMITRARKLGYDLELSYEAIVGYPEKMKEIFNEEVAQSSYLEWTQSMAHYIEEEVNHAAQSIKRKAMATFQANQVIIFLEVPEEASRETINSFLDLLNRRFAHLFPGVHMMWGIGDGSDSIFSFSKSYEQANQALDIGQKRRDLTRKVFYSETRVDRVLQAMANYDDLKEVILSVITPLYKYDQQRNMDLIHTFTTYHRNQSKVSLTARVLHLHRQSLLYRLRKIEALTGLSLANPDDVFLLELSIRIWDLQPVSEL